MKITEKAMVLFSRMLISCRVIGAINSIEKQIVFLSQGGREINTSKFERGLAVKTDLLGNLALVAQDLGKKEIDREVIIRYFGGKRHIEKISRMIDDESNYLERSGREFLLRHILCGIVITARDGEYFSGRYENSGKTLIFSRLLPFKSDISKVRIGLKVFVHFNSIIKLDPDKKFWGDLLKEQAGSQRFMEALDHFNGQEIASEAGLGLLKRAFEVYDI